MDWFLVDSLVGAQGEIMLIKLDTKIGLNSSELKQLLTKDGAGDDQEPSFQES